MILRDIRGLHSRRQVRRHLTGIDALDDSPEGEQKSGCVAVFSMRSTISLFQWSYLLAAGHPPTGTATLKKHQLIVSALQSNQAPAQLYQNWISDPTSWNSRRFTTLEVLEHET